MAARHDIYRGTRKVRFTLGKKGHNTLFVIGLNPSTADKDNADRTITMVEGIAHRNGFDGFVMLNICALRATDPNSLPHVGTDNEMLARLAKCNIQAIQSALNRQCRAVIWAAWGNTIMKRGYLPRYLREIEAVIPKHKAIWVNYGELTKRGHPRHPARMGFGDKLQLFSIEEYLATLPEDSSMFSLRARAALR